MLIAKAIGILKMRLGATSFVLVEVNVTSSMYSHNPSGVGGDALGYMVKRLSASGGCLGS